MILFGLFLMFLGIAFYFLPTIIAYNRQHANRMPILLLNLFLGWTLIGWVLALVWSATAHSQAGMVVPQSRTEGFDERMDRLERQLNPKDVF